MHDWQKQVLRLLGVDALQHDDDGKDIGYDHVIGQRLNAKRRCWPAIPPMVEETGETRLVAVMSGGERVCIPDKPQTGLQPPADAGFMAAADDPTSAIMAMMDGGPMLDLVAGFTKPDRLNDLMSLLTEGYRRKYADTRASRRKPENTPSTRILLRTIDDFFPSFHTHTGVHIAKNRKQDLIRSWVGMLNQGFMIDLWNLAAFCRILNSWTITVDMIPENLLAPYQLAETNRSLLADEIMKPARADSVIRRAVLPLIPGHERLSWDAVQLQDDCLRYRRASDERAEAGLPAKTMMNGRIWAFACKGWHTGLMRDNGGVDAVMRNDSQIVPEDADRLVSMLNNRYFRGQEARFESLFDADDLTGICVILKTLARDIRWYCPSWDWLFGLFSEAKACGWDAGSLTRRIMSENAGKAGEYTVHMFAAAEKNSARLGIDVPIRALYTSDKALEGARLLEDASPDLAKRSSDDEDHGLLSFPSLYFCGKPISNDDISQYELMVFAEDVATAHGMGFSMNGLDRLSRLAGERFKGRICVHRNILSAIHWLIRERPDTANLPASFIVEDPGFDKAADLAENRP